METPCRTSGRRTISGPSGSRITSLVATYSGFVLVWFLAYLFWPDEWWPFILLNKLAFHFLVAAVPMLVFAASTRNALSVVIALIPAAVFSHFYAPFFMPASNSAPLTSDIRVMSYNVWNQNKDVDSIVQAIRIADPDVLIIQELVGDIQAALTRQISTELPYHFVSEPVHGGTTALFSRYPLENARRLDLTVDRPAIVADLSVPAGKLRVIGAHLYPSYYAYHDRPMTEIPGAIEQYIADQKTQVRLLVSEIREAGDRSLVLACDCNVQRTSSSRPMLEEVLTDSAIVLGWQLGEPPPYARFERNIDHIDYIWVRGAITPVSLFRSRRTGGSDHAPIFADLRL